MPIPSKKTGEDRQNFIARCMSDETMKKEYSDSKERIAVCLSQIKTEGSLLQEVHDELLAKNSSWDE